MRLSNIELSTDVHMAEFKHLDIKDDAIILHPKPGRDYIIEINRAVTCKSVCNWLGQIAEKTWGTKEVLGELVIALNIVNGDLRGIE